jgi:hypothetical protein
MHALENLLHREIELVAEKTLQNRYLIQSIESHKKCNYYDFPGSQIIIGYSKCY